ncbi:MAG: site-specific DNA-methyltransferase [Fibrobacterota bacterium]|nr:MAG: site-specific DNA-methyltransferase [Fibrobacterota bacterium]
MYIDPPYNTDAGPIIYKNEYRSSSWMTFISDRLSIAKALMNNDGVLCATIDDYQVHELAFVLDGIFGRANILGTALIRNNPSGRSTVRGFSICHEYGFFYGVRSECDLERLPRNEKQLDRFSVEDGVHVDWRNFRKDGGAVTHRSERPKQCYPLYICPDRREIRIPEMKWDDTNRSWIILEHPKSNEITLLPIDEKGRDRVWSLNHISAKENMCDLEVRNAKDGSFVVYRKHIPEDGVLPRTWWDKKEYAAREYGSSTLTKMFGDNQSFSFAKSPFAVQDSILIGGLKGPDSNFVLDYYGGSGTTAHGVISMNRADDGRRRFILVEMGDYFDSVTKPRIAKAIYSADWKDGKPTTRNTGISHCFKYIRLESYEDTLNNLRFVVDSTRDHVMAQNPSLREDYMLHYQLDVETRGSASLLNIEQFANPTGYTLTVKKPGTDESSPRAVDLLETFNYLIGLRLEHLMAPQIFGAKFKRIPDPELPTDQHTKLVLDGALKHDSSGAWTFRLVKGWVPASPAHPNNGQQERVLIVWRNLTGDLEQDNAVLDALFEKLRINPRDFEYDTIYVNGSNNLPNLKRDDESWKVRLIEEEFHKRMWAAEGGA